MNDNTWGDDESRYWDVQIVAERFRDYDSAVGGGSPWPAVLRAEIVVGREWGESNGQIADRLGLLERSVARLVCHYYRSVRTPCATLVSVVTSDAGSNSDSGPTTLLFAG